MIVCLRKVYVMRELLTTDIHLLLIVCLISMVLCTDIYVLVLEKILIYSVIKKSMMQISKESI